MQQPKSIKSHVVPKAYLNRFTQKNGKLIKIKRDLARQPKPTEVHPSSICYSKGFYEFNRIDSIDGKLVKNPNLLEEQGFLYENKLNKLINKIISPNSQLSLIDALEVSQLLLDLKIRNPYVRDQIFTSDNIKASFDRIVSEERQKWDTGESVFQEPGVPFEEFEKVADLLKNRWTNNEESLKEAHNRSLLEVRINPNEDRLRTLQILLSSQWVLFQTTLNHQFITSDNPGFSIDKKEVVHNLDLSSGSVLIFPLTPFYALAIYIGNTFQEELPANKFINRVNIDPDRAKLVNYFSWLIANKEVYAAHEKPLLQTWYSAKGSKLII